MSLHWHILILVIGGKNVKTQLIMLVAVVYSCISLFKNKNKLGAFHYKLMRESLENQSKNTFYMRP
jgi:hypothetical protein